MDGFEHLNTASLRTLGAALGIGAIAFALFIPAPEAGMTPGQELLLIVLIVIGPLGVLASVLLPEDYLWAAALILYFGAPSLIAASIWIGCRFAVFASMCA
jgi:hypothetical protein